MMMQKRLDELVEKLKKAHGAELESIVLYGSAASGDFQEKHSDLNVICVLSQIGTKQLRSSEPIFRWWRDLGHPAPLLLTAEEIRTSADCFALEFSDILEAHRILAGSNPFAGLEIGDRDYRARVEHELRTKLLRLRQKAAGMMEDRPLLLRLMTDSVATFCVLFRHALALMGEPRKFAKRDVVEQARLKLGIDAQPFNTLLDLREDKLSARGLEATPLLASYLKEVQTVITAVDQLGRLPLTSEAQMEGDQS
ncbi:MAG: nucleotidyltransferase domain-containing protein [Acidobacteria bacterium]|nr:nucleotidyltransferase domain-containing protein [Acidobacteriota bacterium]